MLSIQNEFIAGAGIVYHMSKKELEKMDSEAVENPEVQMNGTDMKEINNGQTNPGFEEKL